MVHMEGSNRKTGMLLRVCTLLRKDMDGKKNKEIMDLRYNIQLLVLGEQESILAVMNERWGTPCTVGLSITGLIQIDHNSQLHLRLI